MPGRFDRLPGVVSVLASTVTTEGLWLIGVGAFLVAIITLSGSPPRLHLQFAALGDERKDRLVSSGTAIGLATTAVGSALVAIGSEPAVWFVAVSAATLVVFGWLLQARQVRALWVARRDEAAARLRQNQDLAREAWQFEASVLLSRWRWALSHPLTHSNATSWPYEYLEGRIGEAPPGVPPEWYSTQGIQLRRSQPSRVRIAPEEAPGWLADIVSVALGEDWPVLRSGAMIVFYTPDGLRYETTDVRQHSVTQPLTRIGLLRALGELGLPTHTGLRGQLLPGRDTGHLVASVTQHARHQDSVRETPADRA